METMLFPDEVIQPDSIEELAAADGDVKTTKRELDMAKQLIESLSGDFDPSEYRDEYRERVLDLIERKAAGETITIEEPAAEQKEVPDLMAALEASIAGLEEPAEEEGGRRAQRRLEARSQGRRQQRRSRCRSRVEVEVEGRRLSLSNLDKVMYPATGFTKGQVIDYYTRVAPVLLPHLRDRPLTLKRYPNGVEGRHFYEKQCPSHRPDWVRSEPVELRSKTIQFCICDDLPTLVWLANLADLELHPSLSKVPGGGAARRSWRSTSIPARRRASPSAARSR